MLTDPMRKEVAAVRKRIDLANRDLKSLAQISHKKVTILSLSLSHFDIMCK